MELKLFFREPVTTMFALALPVIFLFAMAEVFGKIGVGPDMFRGVGALNYYTPAYIGLVIAAIGVVSLPVHIANYRERGFLRRLQASPLPLWSLFGAQLIVTFAIALAGAVILAILSFIIYNTNLPRDIYLFIPAYIASVLSFTAVGVFLGAVLPNARSAQGVGLLLFFVMFIVSGTGPPPEVMTDIMRTMGNITPLPHVVRLLQDTWLGFGWNMSEFLIIMGITVAASLLSVRFFRWE